MHDIDITMKEAQWGELIFTQGNIRPFTVILNSDFQNKGLESFVFV